MTNYDPAKLAEFKALFEDRMFYISPRDFIFPELSKEATCEKDHTVPLIIEDITGGNCICCFARQYGIFVPKEEKKEDVIIPFRSELSKSGFSVYLLRMMQVPKNHPYKTRAVVTPERPPEEVDPVPRIPTNRCIDDEAELPALMAETQGLSRLTKILKKPRRISA